MKKLISLLTSAVLLLSCTFAAPAPVHASDDIITISSASGLKDLAEKCVLDSYSDGLTVRLEKDIDLKGSGFVSIPYFSGVFDGNGHTVSNIRINGKVSSTGFIRFTSEKAKIRNLNVRGTIEPSGSASAAGGIVGENAGTIDGCTFRGTVRGTEDIGGIAGINTGLITGCSFEGKAEGQHRTGGIAGSNQGTIQGCTNSGRIDNAVINVPKQRISSFDIKSFDISEASEDDFLDITDIGGIAGLSDGIILSCENKGAVGYDRIGYNVGGIAGRQTGKLLGCSNSGIIIGKKDVGGITGQAVPYSAWDFSQSKLTKLNNAVNEISSNVEKMRNDAGTSASDIRSQLDTIKKQLRQVRSDTKSAAQQTKDNLSQARTTADNLISDIRSALERHDHKKTKELLLQLKSIFKDDNTVIDLNEVFSLLSQIRQEEKQHFEDEHLNDSQLLSDELEEIIASADYTAPDTDSIFSDIKAVSDSGAALSSMIGSDAGKLREDSDKLRASIQQLPEIFTATAEQLTQVKTDLRMDVSVSRKGSYDRGIITRCKNSGNVNAETNAGGIAGSVGFELEFDAEDKLQLSDFMVNDAGYLVYSLISSCESSADITAKKQSAGGIIGSADFGLAEKSTASGTITVSAGQNCGGIAGKSSGTIDNSCSRCILYASGTAGGIAGWGNDISGCKAYSYIRDSEEYTGSIAGRTDGKVSGCYFVENSVGGIDGVSYKGSCESLSYEEMLTRDDIPDIFKKITVSFIADGEVIEVREVPYGGSIDKLPEVPMDGKLYWKWDDFDSKHIYYSQIVKGSYKKPKTTIATPEDIPLMLAEGTFYEGQKLTAEKLSYDIAALPYNGREPIAAYRVSVSSYSGKLKMRMKAEAGGELYISGSSGESKLTSYERDGSYIVFEMENGSNIAYLPAAKINVVPWILISAAAAMVAAFVIVIVVRSPKKRKRRTA